MSTDIKTIQANGIEIAYETFGNPTDPAVVLVMGLGTQMIAWPDRLCEDLAAGGRYVIRYDNRDVGLSTHLHDLPVPDIKAVALRRKRPAYLVSDMADDLVGLLDGLGLDRVHLVGASMGGFIVQTAALAHPERFLSLTLMMTSTGSRRVGQAKPALISRLARGRRAMTRAEAIDAAVETFRLIGSKMALFDEAHLRDLAGRSYDRSTDPKGYLRQLGAVIAQPNRTKELTELRVPTLVLHGLHDPLVAPSGGLALARLIRGARFVGFSGMGHDLPPSLLPDFTREVLQITS
ncbi:MAG: alpha/beta fold hydrolase [Actinobacteria bacterium]|nr:alpha/beta fold hydrolase [Actinomycetota bacterium]MCA1722256.1 alpha/beta fold hydrolase [Actinomycetota bacterium]